MRLESALGIPRSVEWQIMRQSAACTMSKTRSSGFWPIEFDGGLQQVRARRGFAHEKGCLVQFLVQWVDSAVRQKHLQILQKTGYTASRVAKLRGFGMGAASFMVKACWEATWEPEFRLCQDDAHQRLIDDYRATHLEVPPKKMWASNIDQQQCNKG